MLANGEGSIPYYKLFRMKHVEIAIWPLLYVQPQWCESAIEGGTSRLSANHAFYLNFAQDFGLLQYQYDRWLFKTVTGAVETGKIHRTSPLRALETKSIGTAYWQWQHRILKDVVRQFDSMSPAEWNVPLPDWLTNRQKLVSSNLQMLPYLIPPSQSCTCSNSCAGDISRLQTTHAGNTTS